VETGLTRIRDAVDPATQSASVYHDWTAAGQSKILRDLVMVLLGILGMFLYLLIARPALDRTPLSVV
jgi:hypothetical protein